MSDCKTGYSQKYHDSNDCGCDMLLPEGKTCGDCYHIYRCLSIGYTSSEANTRCDFAPSRFIEKPKPVEGPVAK